MAGHDAARSDVHGRLLNFLVAAAVCSTVTTEHLVAAVGKADGLSGMIRRFASSEGGGRKCAKPMTPGIQARYAPVLYPSRMRRLSHCWWGSAFRDWSGTRTAHPPRPNPSVRQPTSQRP